MSYLALFAAILLVLLHGYVLGSRLLRGTHWAISIIPGVAVFFALQSLVQTIWYYAGQNLNSTSDLISLGIAVLLTHAITWTRRKPPAEIEAETDPTEIRRYILGAIFLLPALASTLWIIRVAYRVATTDSIRTPWPLFPSSTLWVVALGWLAFLCSIWFVRSRIFATAHGILALASTLSITPLVYRIGYGFDGFLHVASEKILLTTGTLSPKPLYYIGQYVFTTWLARLSHIPVADIDRWLLPLAAAILLPITFYVTTKRHTSGSFAALALIPLGSFIATTPQGVAYLFGLIALLFAFSTRADDSVLATQNSPLVAIIFALWSVAVHPLAGIPLLCVTLALVVRPKLLSAAFILFAAISVPTMFAIISKKNGTSITWDLSSLLTADPWLQKLGSFSPYIGNHFVLWPAWATLVGVMLPLLFVILCIVAVLHEREQQKTASLFLLLSAVGLWIAGTALKTTGDFAFLIDYERGNYANRLDTLALLCLIPALLVACNAILSRLRTSPRPLAFAFGAFVLAIATALTYDSLPRNDALVTGHGWSTSRADLDAVDIIDRDAAGKPYTVLANQSVSAAAVAALGFKRYAGDVFFYPIPTGGPLYETYLRMTYNEPSRDTAKDAAALGQTEIVYVVLNNYWWNATNVSEGLRAIANKEWTIDDGKSWVYKFDVSTASSASTTGSN